MQVTAIRKGRSVGRKNAIHILRYSNSKGDKAKVESANKCYIPIALVFGDEGAESEVPVTEVDIED